MKKRLLLLLAVCFASIVAFAQGTSRVAYVSIFESVDDIEDDDELAAATWLLDTYGGDFLYVYDLPNTDLSQYGALWIHIDDEFFPEPAEDFYDDEVMDAIKSYYQGGGNLLLTIHAVGYLSELGRIDFGVDIKGAGSGGDNPDIWYVSPTHGTVPGMKAFDRSGDRLYAGLESAPIVRDNGVEYVQFPLISPGHKEDHNCFWSMSIPGNDIPNDQEAKLHAFQDGYSAEVLGTWAHVQDYFGAAIVRWLPTEEFKGKAITIGVAAYEWNQNSGENLYQSNIEKMTKNALDELTEGKSSVALLEESQIGIYFDGELLRLERTEGVASADMYAVNGQRINSYSAEQLHGGVSVNRLPNGVYILRVNDAHNRTMGVRKVVK